MNGKRLADRPGLALGAAALVFPWALGCGAGSGDAGGHGGAGGHANGGAPSVSHGASSGSSTTSSGTGGGATTASSSSSSSGSTATASSSSSSSSSSSNSTTSTTSSSSTSSTSTTSSSSTSSTSSTSSGAPYQIGPPNTDPNIGNACTSGGNVSFICPRFMLFSPEMTQAASDDETANGWPQGSFNYGVATLNGAPCCACYQIVYGTPTDSSLSFSAPKALVIQNFNTGGAQNAFDIFMGKGGEGAQTNGCSKLYTSYPGIGEPYGGGIRASATPACGTTTAQVASAACVSTITGECDQIQASSSYVTSTTRTSCIEANSAQSLYHDNWNVKARQVECPTALTEVTGCKPNPGGYPKPDPTVQTASQAGSWGSFTTTTMEDCCKPSCAWPGNVSNTQAPWSAMYQCAADGTPLHN